MARAEKKYVERQVERVVTETVKEPDGVTLELSVKEAHALKYLVGIVSGQSDFRSATDAIYYALHRAGVDDSVRAYNDTLRISTPTIKGGIIKMPYDLEVDDRQ